MAFKETFETAYEAEREVQKILTCLKEHSHNSKKMIADDKLIKAYKEECFIESRLEFLNEFLEGQKKEVESELNMFKERIASEALSIKCKQIEEKVKRMFDIEDE
ncbi:hypothetical protein GINT2_001399 [Glugoides intestinalis]